MKKQQKDQMLKKVKTKEEALRHRQIVLAVALFVFVLLIFAATLARV